VRSCLGEREVKGWKEVGEEDEEATGVGRRIFCVVPGLLAPQKRFGGPERHFRHGEGWIGGQERVRGITRLRKASAKSLRRLGQQFMAAGLMTIRSVLGAVLLLAAIWKPLGTEAQPSDPNRDLYLYRMNAGGEIRQVFASIHPTVTPEEAVCGDADDGVLTFYDLGFSFPFYGNPRVREVGVDPNGVLRLDAFGPAFYFCKSLIGQLACSGKGNDANVIAPYSTDLIPGELDFSSETNPGGVFVWKDAGNGMFSVLWEKRKYFNPGNLGIRSVIQAINVTFGVTLYENGRVTFYYEEMSSSVDDLELFYRGLYSGLLAPSHMFSLRNEQSANSIALQSTWDGVTIQNVLTTGSFVDKDEVKPGNVIDMCMVPDLTLDGLEDGEVCVQVIEHAAEIEFFMPKAFSGCWEAMMAFKCIFGDSAPRTNAQYHGDGNFSCPLPNPSFDFDAGNFSLAYVNVDSLNGGDRTIYFDVCTEVSGPTMVTNTSCSLDSLGEPGIPDCAGVCDGPNRFDKDGICCDARNCDGRCLSENHPEVEIAITRILASGITSPSNQIECCLSEEVDCEGMCQGCSCSSCTCANPLPSDRPYCPSSYSTPRPSFPTTPPSNEGSDSLVFRLPTVFLFLIGVLLTSSIIRIARFYFFADPPVDWQLMAHGGQSRRELKGLTPEEIEEKTEVFLFEDTRKPQSVLHTGGSSRSLASSVAFHELDDDEHNGLCAICISEFEDGEELRKLPCGHFFHKDCVDEWFNRSSVCPMCKRDVRTGSQEDYDQANSVREVDSREMEDML